MPDPTLAGELDPQYAVSPGLGLVPLIQYLPWSAVQPQPTAADNVATDPGVGEDTSHVQSYMLGPNYDTQWSIATRYETRGGVGHLPVAAPAPAPTQVVQLVAPRSTRVVRWTAERVGAWPFCPDWRTGSGNEVLSYRSVVPQAPAVGPGGTRVFRVSGLYVYLLLNELVPGATLPAGVPPYSTASPADNTLDTGQFRQGSILQPSE